MEDFQENIVKQKEMNSKTLEQLSNLGIDDDSTLKIEFFFYTDDENKASNLAIDLNQLGYNIETVERTDYEDQSWVVSGWTNKMKMELDTITKWTTQMCSIGNNNDCEFDGWGTFPDQDNLNDD